MGSRYDDFEFAVLVDAVADLATASREGKSSAASVERVLRELAHVLDVMQESEAAGDARAAANGFHAGLGIMAEFEDLQNEVDEAINEFEVDNVKELGKEFSGLQEKVSATLTRHDVESLETLNDTMMLIPDGYTNAEAVLEDLFQLKDLRK